MVSTGTSVDIVKSGGFKISTLEIEAVLLQVLKKATASLDTFMILIAHVCKAE
jgi:acyl-coenzyme A synthetase/AMP-(fatty) acid ligase